MEENYEIDSHVLAKLGCMSDPVSMRTLEAHLIVDGYDHNTFDVQRSIRRLVNSGRVNITKKLELQIAKE